MKELIWKPIPRFDGYMASNFGDIAKNGRLRAKSFTSNGYLKVKIDTKTRTVHRLVASAFYGLPKDTMVVNHKNGNKSDNRIENLEWCTHSENSLHHLLTSKSNNRKIMIDINTGVFYETIKEYCSLYGVSQSTMLWRLKSGKTSLQYS